MKTPGQRRRCTGPNTTITVSRPGRDAAPALIMAQPAIGAKVEGCSFDMNGMQFINTAFLPLSWDDRIAYVPGKGLVNNPGGKSIQNDGLAVAVLIMCDDCELADAEVTRGWDNDVMIARFDWLQELSRLGLSGSRFMT